MRRANPNKKIAYAKWRAENPEKYKESVLRSRAKKKLQKPEEYKEIEKARKARWKLKKIKTDPIFALSLRMRNRINKAFKNKGFKKDSSTEKILGCSFKVFVKHIEHQFIDNMSWENKGEWHLDHIVPLSCATTIEGLEKLSHYSNLRPLWAKENIKKSNNLVLI